jgi:hypothetical protein
LSSHRASSLLRRLSMRRPFFVSSSLSRRPLIVSSSHCAPSHCLVTPAGRDLSSYVFLLCQLVCGSEHTNITVEAQSGECEAFSPLARPANTSQENFALGPTAKKRLQDRCIEELHEVLRFFCLDLGCQHEHGKIYLSSGSLDSITATARCSSCPICNRRYHKDFLPVYRSGVVTFLEWLTLTTKLLFVIDRKIQVSSFLMTSAYWKEILFDKLSTSITRTNVDSLFLLLVTVHLIVII